MTGKLHFADAKFVGGISDVWLWQMKQYQDAYPDLLSPPAEIPQASVRKLS